MPDFYPPSFPPPPTDGSGGGGSSGGAISITADWEFQTATTPAGITNGDIRFNNATQTAATEIYIASIDNNGNDRRLGLDELMSGNQITVQDKTTPTKWHTYTLAGVGTRTGAIGAAGAYYSFPAVFVSTGTGGAIANAVVCAVTLLGTVGAVQNFFTPVNGGSVNMPAGTTDYLSDIAAATTLTGTFTINLPPISGYAIGQRILIADAGATIFQPNGQITFAPNGADSISPASPILFLADGFVVLEASAGAVWQVVAMSGDSHAAMATGFGQDYPLSIGASPPVTVAGNGGLVDPRVSSLTFLGAGISVTSPVSGFVEVSADPGTTGLLVLREDFAGGANVTGQVGTLGWSVAGVPGGVTNCAYQTGLVDHPGIYRIGTTTLANDGASLNLNGSNLSPLMDPLDVGFKMTWVFRLNQLSLVSFRIGIANAAAANDIAQANRKIGLRWDTEAPFSDAGTFKFYSVDGGGVETALSSGVTADTGWHKFTMEVVTAGQVRCQIDAAAPVTLTTTIPALPGSFSATGIVAAVNTRTTASATADVDFMACTFPLTR